MIDPEKSQAPDPGDPPSLVDEELAREVARLLEEEDGNPDHY